MDPSLNMACSKKRRFSGVNENCSEDISLAEIENINFKGQKKRRNSVVASGKKGKKEHLKDLIIILKKLFPNVFKKNESFGTILSKFIEDLVKIEELMEEYEDYNNNIDYIIQAHIIDKQFKYISNINSGGLLDNIRQIAGERYFNQCNSYYEQNFTEIALLGAGAFGKVYTATHKIDKVQYAIKKIKIKSHKKKEIQHSLNEVKTLAKLHHPNVIAYKNAWIQLEPLEENELPSSQSSESSQSNRDDSSMNGINTDMKVCKLKSSQEYVSENESSQDSLNIETGQIFTLYIQMALSTMNLRKWIDNRQEPSDELTIRNIAKQVLRGLDYIHQLKIVHHDINPNNILMTMKLNEEGEKEIERVEIADFGLARYLLNKNHSEIGGTRLYCAPEQLQNKCDSKSDIYSFGIVLFELVYPLKSVCELCKVIESFKKGNDLPPNITNNYPVWESILKKSIHENPQMRASAEDLLNMITKDENMSVSCCRMIHDI